MAATGIMINCRRRAEERRMLASLFSPFVVARATCGVALGSRRQDNQRHPRPGQFVSLFPCFSSADEADRSDTAGVTSDYIQCLRVFAQTQMGVYEKRVGQRGSFFCQFTGRAQCHGGSDEAVGGGS